LTTNDFTPAAARLIESEGDKRFLENRDERFWQVLGQRAETQAETGAEDEGLGDHMPNDELGSFALLTALHRMPGAQCQISAAHGEWRYGIL
jgi:hypothetical protein